MHSKPESKTGFGKHTPPGKHEPKKNRWVKVLGTVFVLFTGSYFLFQNQIVDSQLRPVIEKELARAVNAPVSIQSMRAGLTGNVVLNQVTLNIPGNPWETRVVVEKLSVNIELFNLVFHRKAIENCFKSIAFVQPQITLVKKEGAPVPAPVPPVSAAVSGVVAPLPLIPVPKIIVSKGSFYVQAEKNPREILKGLNFTASTDNGTTWGLLLQAFSPEAKSLGEIRFDGNLRLENLKVSGKVVLQKWPLASIQAVLKELAGWEFQSGTIDAESPVVFQLGSGLWYDAKASLTQATLKTPPPTSITLSQITGRAFIRPNEINVPGELRFQLGETVWRASGLIPFDNRPVAVRTMTDELFLSSVFSEILKLRDWEVDGKGRATLIVAGPLSDPVMQGSAQLGSSHVGKGSLDSLVVNAGYEKGNFKLYKAAGKLYDGDFEANGYMSLSGQKDAPVSLKAVLKNIEAKKLAADFGISGLEGRSDVDAQVSGTLEKPVLSAVSQMILDRTLRKTQFHYGVHTKFQMTDQKISLSAVIDEKAKLEGEAYKKNEDWETQFTLTTGKKSGKIVGKGIWPSSVERPADIRVLGKNIVLREIPFLNDQFPDIKGNVNLVSKIEGRRNELVAEAGLTTDELTIRDSDPEPLNLSLSWKGVEKELYINALSLGEIFSTTGKMGFVPESALDLKIQANDFPIWEIAEILGLDNTPQPFEGFLTGKLRVSGKRKNPIVEGKDGVKLTSVKVGDWYADQVEAVSSFEQDKLQIKRVKLVQGSNTLTANGSWDTRPQPGVMSLHFASRNFQLGKGPFLSGDFQWEAKTGDPFWKNWTGTFSSDSFNLLDLKKKPYQFDDFRMTASSEESVIRGKIRVGKTLAGSAKFDLASSPVKFQGLFKIEPVLLTQVPELTQFLPPDLKLSGRISGQLQFKDGTFAELPIAGSFKVLNGKIQKRDFERAELNFSGNKAKISPSFIVVDGETNYSLSGTLESPKSFWDAESKIVLKGQVQKEKLKNLLGQAGIETEKHLVSGLVNGDLTVSGSLYNPSVGFSVTGDNLQYDTNRVPSAELHFSRTGGIISLEKNRITLTQGEINIEKGTAKFDPKDPSLVSLDVYGSTQNISIGSIFDLTSQMRLSGNLALEEKPGRPTFDGVLSYLDMRKETLGEKKISMEDIWAAIGKNSIGIPVLSGKTETKKKLPFPFDLSIQVQKKIIDFKPMETDKTQLVGRLDLSQDQKIIFQNIHLEHSEGIFSVDGTLDLKGTSHFVSDAKNIPIEALGKWFLPKFPLSGTGSYHLIFDGTLESPVFTTSLSVAGGRIGDLEFDLLDGELKSKESVLALGTKEVPITLSRKGLYSFNVWGKTPLAFTKTGWVKVHNREMDINAQMEKGDFGIILSAGLGKKASGNMDFSAHVGGTVDTPVLTLDLDLNQCQMVPNLVAQSIDDINGRIKVRNNRLAVEDLNGRIGQGRVFISSPPIEESKMVLENFIPNYLDFRVQTVGDHGVWLSIPTIMKKGEWGEIFFYGTTPKDPMLIRGKLSEPHVIGTAFLDSGHFTFPPEEAVDDKGEKIEYRQLAGVFFELKLAAGKNTWYSNEFNSNYIELKVDPGDEFMIEGKDADRTPLEAGIKCHGTAGSNMGYLRYLGHEFKMEHATLYIPKGKSPNMKGRAVDKLRDVEVVSAGGGVRKTDVDVWVDFVGPFGHIDFKLDSNPRFHNDPEAHKTILLSYIMFGQDMTNYTYSKEQLQAAYESKVGRAATDAALDYLDRFVSYRATVLARPLFNKLGNLEFKMETNFAGKNASGGSPVSAVGVSQIAEAGGNTVSGTGTVSLAKVSLTKHLSQKLSVSTTFDINRNLQNSSPGVQPEIGLGYSFNKNLSGGVTQGTNLSGQAETRVGLSFSESLPDIMAPKLGDKERPRFERCDVFSVGPGKYQLIWVTDKVTQSEVRVIDPDGKIVKVVVEKKQHDYRHEIIVDSLDPEMEYQIQVSVKDLNQNETVKTQKVSSNSN